MRVAVVVEWLDPSRGGAETSTLQFLRRLASREVSLEVFTRSRVAPEPGITVRTMATTSSTRRGATAEFIAKAERAAIEARCDLVHAFVPCAGADVYQPRGGTVAETIRRTIAARRSLICRASKKIELLLAARQRLVWSKERSLLTGASRPVVIAISDYVVRQLHGHYRYPDSHIRRVFNGVEVYAGTDAERSADRLRVRADYGIDENDLLLLAVCHNFRLKGVGSLIQSLPRVRKSLGGAVRAMVVGRDRPGPWRRLAKRLGVADTVRFTGPTEDTGAFYHAADVLVHPTYYDPCSRVVLEAIAYGAPVVCTRFDGASEVLEDGVSGVILESPDAVDILAERIVWLSDGAVRERLANQARLVAPQVEMKRHVDGVLEVYESLTGSGGRKRAAARSAESPVCLQNGLSSMGPRC